MNRSFKSSVALTIAFAAIVAPARSAQVVQFYATNGTQTGVACPATVQFHGQIFALPNIPFTYWFITIVNGVKRVTPKIGAIAPQNGAPIPITYSLSIASSSDQTATSIVELDVADVGREAVRSQQIPFSVTCSRAAFGNDSGRPTDAPVSSKSAIGSAATDSHLVQLVAGMTSILPEPPSGMAATTDLYTCTQHLGAVGGFVCSAVLPDGGLALVWDKRECETCVEGYHLYRVDGARRDLLETQAAANGSGAVLGKERGPFENRCYAVTAYKAALESKPSAAACIGGGQIAKTTSYQPTSQRSDMVISRKWPGLGSEALRTYSTSSPALIVGFEHNTEKHVFNDGYFNSFSRGGLLFDLAGLIGKSVSKAVLHLHVDHAVIGHTQAGVTDHLTSCATQISAGIERWWTHTDPIGGTPPSTAYDMLGPDLDLDVTQIVKSWANRSQTNFGVVLYGGNEDLSAFTEAHCQTTYTNGSTLDVTYY